jgi:hypothetical protein
VVALERLTALKGVESLFVLDEVGNGNCAAISSLATRKWYGLVLSWQQLVQFDGCGEN